MAAQKVCILAVVRVLVPQAIIAPPHRTIQRHTAVLRVDTAALQACPAAAAVALARQAIGVEKHPHLLMRTNALLPRKCQPMISLRPWGLIT